MHRMLLWRRQFVVGLFDGVVVDVIVDNPNVPTVDHTDLVLLFLAVATAAVTADTVGLDERTTARECCSR